MSISIPDEMVEQLICQKILTDDSYRVLFQDVFDKRWIDDFELKSIIQVAIAYGKKYSKAPNQRVVEALISKLAQSDDNFVVESVINKFVDVINLEIGHGNDDFTKECIFSFIKRRGIYFSILDNLEKIEKKHDVSDAIESFQKILNISIDSDLGTNYQTDIKAHLQRMQNPEARLSTGFRDLDFQLGGGLYRNGKCLFVPMGKPGIGKSLWISNLSVNDMMNQGTPVIITLEMAEDIYAQRIDAHISDIEMNSIGTYHNDVLQKVETFFEKYNKSNLLIKEFPPDTISTSSIENYITRLISKGIKPSMILVDYINLLLPNSGASTKGTYERVGEVAKNLRAMSYKFNAPVVAPTQINRCLDLDSIVEEKTRGNIAISKLNVGDQIKGWNGYVEVKTLFDIAPRQVYRISTASGKTIICSNRHKFPTSKGIQSIETGLEVGISLMSMTNKKFRYDKIVSIDKLDIRDTIDIEVSHDHLFVANGILTHNSGYDTTDITMSNTSDSAGINHHADAIMALFEGEGDREAGITNGVMLKNRLGGVINKVINFNVDWRSLRITDFNKANVIDSQTSIIETELGEI